MPVFAGAPAHLPPRRILVNTTRRRTPALLSLAAAASLAALALLSGCDSRDVAGLDVARARIEPVVFDEGFDDDVYFQAFSGTDPYATSIDSVFAYNSLHSWKVVVPPNGSALGGYAGGVLTSGAPRDLADYNALVFWVRSSANTQVNEVGFGNDNTGTSLLSAGRAAVAVNNTWQQVVIPIPAPQKMIAERGMFTIAEGYEAQIQNGHTLWFDDIHWENLATISNVRPTITASNKQYFKGGTASIDGISTIFNVNGADVTVNHMPGYFNFTSSDPSVAEVQGKTIRVVGTGTASITGTMETTQPDGILKTLDVTGAVTLTGYDAPATAAPVPTVPEADVISLYSDTYGNWPVTSWNPHWQYSTAQNETYTIGGDATIMYSGLNFVGIVFQAQNIDISQMTHMHLDVYAPAGTDFKVKLVNYSTSAGTTMNGQAEVTLNAASTPAFTPGGWSSLEIPMSSFPFNVGLVKNHIGQLILSTTDAQLVLVDNIYWHK